MPRYWLMTAVTAAILSFAAIPAPAQDTAAPNTVTQLSWPRDFDQGDQRVEIYQPQIENWSGDRLSGRAAIAIGAKDGQPVYGVARFSADTDIDKTAGLVRLRDITIDAVEVPTAPDKAPELQKALQARLPADGMTVALDHLQTSYAAQQQIAKQAGVPVQNDPPRIVFASTPTVLVSIDGDPVLRPVDGSAGYQRVVNARALILQEGTTFHVQAAGSWYAASALGGTWVVTAAPSAALQAAAKAAAQSAAPDPLLPEDGKPPATPPSLLVVTQPTELVVTSGPPQIAPVAGVGLLTMTNADHAVFVDPSSNGTYVLISGRWFKSTGLDGPWSFVAPDLAAGRFRQDLARRPEGRRAGLGRRNAAGEGGGDRGFHSADRDGLAQPGEPQGLLCRRRAGVPADRGHAAGLCRQHAGAGHPGRCGALLRRVEGCLVRRPGAGRSRGGSPMRCRR